MNNNKQTQLWMIIKKNPTYVFSIDNQIYLGILVLNKYNIFYFVTVSI